ncbi:50S ribosomal protein L23 [bacterium BMS3Bbin03]|nr:50S ribosomal protein L23 [bacterium BMS3Bbin03]HDL78522.1 50S ribosomal protein L23 [Bacteroidota bacterium]HDZ12425.1 50S ribosomal protein L23 [Bacteroidota bacterium]
MKDTFNIIIRPILTEKMTTLKNVHRQYAFHVDLRANKIEIKRAVEQRFDVTVESVRTMIMPGKFRRLGRYEGKTAKWKKAVVTLKKDEEIEYVAGAV